MSASKKKKKNKNKVNNNKSEKIVLQNEKQSQVEENTKEKTEVKNETNTEIQRKNETENTVENLKIDDTNHEKTDEVIEVKNEEKSKNTEKSKNNENAQSEEKKENKNKKKNQNKEQNKKFNKEQEQNKENAENEEQEKNQDKENVKKEDSNKEKNEDKLASEKQDNKLKVKEESELIKVEEKPDYVKDMLKKKKRKTIIFICIVIIIVLFLIFSTIFALSNVRNTNIITGVKVKNTDLSNLSIEDATKKLKETMEAELLEEIKLKYGDEYEITLAPNQIEFKYDIETAINNAYSMGRTGNILENNYKILFTTLFGKEENIEYSYNEELLNAFIDDLSSKIPGVVVEPAYYIDDTNLIISQGIDGISVKKETLKQLIINSILERNYKEINTNNYNFEIEIPVQETEASKIDIDKIYLEVRRDPQDAYFELDPYQIYPDLDGIDFDIENAKEILKEYKEEYSIPLTITKANKTIDDLGTEAFPYLISSFSTKYDASNINRSTNLEIAAQKINGKVLMPGEIFSYNKVVGKRTVEEGYRDAKIYADGGVVDGLAGGICQISSTLYNAVLLANLEIVERRNHTYVTSYVAAGRDATVVYGAIDFQFRNSRNYPIKIEASVKNGIAEFNIHGMQEENEYDIKIIPVTTASIPYATEYIQDINLMPGQQVITQAGHAGYKVTTYIEKRLGGELISKEVLSNDTYSPMKTIINIGP